jgi:hypothetical protein
MGGSLKPDKCLFPSIPRKMFNINKRASKETAGNGGSEKKKQHQSTLFSAGNEVLRGLNKAHKGSVS